MINVLINGGFEDFILITATFGSLSFGIISRRRIIFHTTSSFGPQLSVFTETFGKGIIIDFQLGDLFVLVGRHPQEGGLREHERVVGGELQLHEVVALHDMDTGHVLVHAGKDDMAVLI